MKRQYVSLVAPATRLGELLVQKEVKDKSVLIVSLDPEALHEKNLDIQHVPTIATTFKESIVLLDAATALSG